MTVEDDPNAPCSKCKYGAYSPFSIPCVECGFDCHNYEQKDNKNKENKEEVI